MQSLPSHCFNKFIAFTLRDRCQQTDFFSYPFAPPGTPFGSETTLCGTFSLFLEALWERDDPYLSFRDTFWALSDLVRVQESFGLYSSCKFLFSFLRFLFWSYLGTFKLSLLQISKKERDCARSFNPKSYSVISPCTRIGASTCSPVTLIFS